MCLKFKLFVFLTIQVDMIIKRLSM